MVTRAFGTARIEHRQLPFEANRRATDQWFAGRDTGCIDSFAGGEVIGTIEHQIHCRHGGGQAILIQGCAMGDQFYLGIDRAQSFDRRINLAQADACLLYTSDAADE